MPSYSGYELWHNENGSITFQCTPALPGTYRISVEHDGVPLEGLPVSCVVQKADEGFVTAYKAGAEADLNIDLDSQQNTMLPFQDGAEPSDDKDDPLKEEKTDTEFKDSDDEEEEEAAVLAGEEFPEAEFTPTADDEDMDTGDILEQDAEQTAQLLLQNLQEQQQMAQQQEEMDVLEEEGKDNVSAVQQIPEPIAILPPEAQQSAVGEVAQLVEQAEELVAVTDEIQTQEYVSIEQSADQLTEEQQQVAELQYDVDDDVPTPGVQYIQEDADGRVHLVQGLDGTQVQYIQVVQDTGEPTTTAVAVQGQEEEEDVLSGAVAMEITSLPQEMTDLGDMVAPGSKYVLEKAPPDPTAADPTAPVYVLKERYDGEGVVTAPGRISYRGTPQRGTPNLRKQIIGARPMNPRVNKDPILISSKEIALPKTYTKSLGTPKRSVDPDDVILIGPGAAPITRQPAYHRHKAPVTPSVVAIEDDSAAGKDLDLESLLVSGAQSNTELMELINNGTDTEAKQEKVNVKLEKDVEVEAMEDDDTDDPAPKPGAEELAPKSDDDDPAPELDEVPSTSTESAAKDTSDDVSVVEVLSPTRRSRRTVERKKIFQCRKLDCEQTFATSEEMEQHHQTDHQGATFICPTLDCKRVFLSRKNWKMHRDKVHSEEEPVDERKFPCTVKKCKKLFDSFNKMKSHVETGHKEKKKFMCDECGKLFASQKALTTHAASHGEPVTFTCKEEDCEKQFKSKKSFDAHIQKHFEGLWCTPCGRAYSSKDVRDKHFNQRHVENIKEEVPKTCTECNKEFSSKSAYHKHMSTIHSDSAFSCPVCNKVCKTIENLTRHKKTHTDDKPFMCDLCGQFFKTKDILRCHREYMHRMEKVWETPLGSETPVLVERPARPFVCKYCDRTFKRKAILVEHIKAAHESTERIPCSHPGCPKVFPTHTLMKTHIRSVHKPRPVRQQCTHTGCGKQFNTVSALNIHMNTHLNLRYQCAKQGCTHSFTTKHHMLSHYKLKHTELDDIFACSLCGKRFKLKEQVKAHLDSHKTERKYKCEVCGKGFTTQSRLTAHRKIHIIGEGEHECMYCGKRFIRKYRLKQHMMKHDTREITVAYSIV